MRCVLCNMLINSFHTPAACKQQQALAGTAARFPKIESPEVVSVEEIEVIVAKSRNPFNLSEATPDDITCFMCGTVGKHTQAECDAARAADMLARPDHYAPPTPEQQAIIDREGAENEAWDAYCESRRDAEDELNAG